jgi:hypothetical protein
MAEWLFKLVLPILLASWVGNVLIQAFIVPMVNRTKLRFGGNSDVDVTPKTGK